MSKARRRAQQAFRVSLFQLTEGTYTKLLALVNPVPTVLSQVTAACSVFP
ncbi:MAG TPA: hypothetical protein VMW80_05245 [Candidatus Dormibacteraeota bacterium]|nr:hypothetical protein [Candidatus Dormibacteraeota bacterium]